MTSNVSSDMYTDLTSIISLLMRQYQSFVSDLHQNLVGHAKIALPSLALYAPVDNSVDNFIHAVSSL